MSESDLIAKRARSDAARSRLFATLGTVQERLSPANLASRAIDDVAQGAADLALRGVSGARRHAGLIGLTFGAVLLVAARRPILRAITATRTTHEPIATHHSESASNQGSSK